MRGALAGHLAAGEATRPSLKEAAYAPRDSDVPISARAIARGLSMSTWVQVGKAAHSFAARSGLPRVHTGGYRVSVTATTSMRGPQQFTISDDSNQGVTVRRIMVTLRRAVL